jgi:hypothetical protein
MNFKLCLSVLISLGCLAASSLSQAPTNDNFANRTVLAGPLPISATGLNFNATAELGEPVHYYYSPSHSVWWSWTSDRDRTMRAEPTGTNFDSVLAVYESALPDPNIIVDNADASGVTLTGNWTASTVVTGFYGTDYLHDDNAEKGTKSVRFTPTIPTAGKYDVYLRWPASPNRATQVPVDVVHAGGTTTFYVDETTAGGAWVQVNTAGPLQLNAGTSASVLIRNDDTTDGYVVADAVRFVPSPSFADLTRVASSDYSLTFTAKAGHTYQIAVDGFGYYDYGNIGLVISEAPSITSPATLFATINEPLSYQITANNNPTSFYVYGLPPGVSYDSTTGLISGTPLYYTGNYSVYLTAYGPTSTAYGTLALSVGTLAPAITSSTSANGAEGQPFSYQITATHEPTSYSATGLPPGLLLDSSSGLISGTPTSFGSFYVTLSATNSHGTSPLAYLYLTIATSRPTITTDYANVMSGMEFVYQIYADKNPTSYDATGLPPGLAINQTTGLISGTPTASGLYEITLSATNSFGPGTGTLYLTVTAPVSDSFAGRIKLSGTSVSLYADNFEATKETGEPDHAGDPGGASVWWKWIPTESGQYQIAVEGDFDVLFTIYQGTSLRSLKPLMSNADVGNGRINTVIFEAIAGRQYQIAIDGAAGSVGSFALSIEKIGEDIAKVLTVTTTSGGSVTPGFLGTSFRHIGAQYTVTATPAPGFLFTGWTGSVFSSARKLTFSMQEGTLLEASFAPSPFIAVKGTYYGLITSESGTASSSGIVKFALDGTGAFTASFIFGGRSYNLRGTFDTALALGGIAEVTMSIPRGSEWPLELTLSVDLSNPGGPLSGYIADDVVSAAITADRSSLNAKKNPALQAGQYTVLGYTGSSDAPQGSAYGCVKVKPNGTVRFVGVLPDGKRVTQSAQLSDSGRWPFYLALDGGEGSLVGTLAFENLDYSDVSGALTWLKPPKRRDPHYPDGFVTELDLFGGRYAVPPAHNATLDFSSTGGAAIVSIDPSEIVGLRMDIEAVLTNENEVKADPTLGFAMKIKSANGLFTGHFVDPFTNRQIPFAGAVVQKQYSAGGLFKVGGQSSAIYLHQ